MSQLPSGIDPVDLMNFQAQMQAYGQQGNSNLQQLILQLVKGSQDKYNQAYGQNQSRYNDILQLLGINRNSVLGDVANVGASQIADTNKDFKDQLNNSLTANSDRGFASSTLRTQAVNANAKAKSYALNNINNSLLNNRISANQSTLAPIVNTMQNVTQTYPNTSGIDSGLLQLAAGGGASGFSGGGFSPTSLLGGLGGGLLTGGAMGGEGPVPNSVAPVIRSAVSGAPRSTFNGQLMTAVPQLRRSTPAPAAPLRSSGNGLTPDQQQNMDMISKGYVGIGNGNWLRSGSGGFGGSQSYDGRVPDQIVSGQPPAGTNIVPGQAQLLSGGGTGFGGGGLDGLLGGLLSHLLGGGGSGYGQPQQQAGPAQYNLGGNPTPARQRLPAPRFNIRPTMYGVEPSQFASIYA